MSAKARVPRNLSRRTPDMPVRDLVAEAIVRQPDPSLRAIAQRVTEAGWDLDGDKSTVHPSTVHDWLNGTIPGPRMRRLIAHALDIPQNDLDAAATHQRKHRWRRQPSGTYAVDRVAEVSGAPAPASALDSQTPSDSVDSDGVKRRAFGLWLASAGAAVATMDFERTAALLAGTRPDHAALDDMETLTRDLVQREATLAPRSLFPAVQGHLQGLRDMLLWTPTSLAPRGYSLAGQTALLAGYLMFKQDRHTDADTYYSMAGRFGELAGDTRLRAALLVLQAQRWEGENLPREGENHALALSLLDRAVALLGSDPDPAAAAHVLTFRARSYAEASRAEPSYAATAMHDLDRLHTYLSRMPSTDTSLYIVESVRGEAIQKGAMALVHLDRSAEAATQLEGLLTTVVRTSDSWRAHILTNLAVARAASGHADHALELLNASLQLASHAAALRAINRVRYARQRWLANHDGPAALSLDEQLRALVESPLGPEPGAPRLDTN